MNELERAAEDLVEHVDAEPTAMSVLQRRADARRRRRHAAVLTASALVVIIATAGMIGLGRARNNPDQSVSVGGSTPSAGIGFPHDASGWERYASAHHPEGLTTTFAAYEAAVTATVTCLRAQGVVVTDPTPSPSGRFLFYTYSGAGNPDQLAQQCRAHGETEAARQWTALTTLTPSDYAALQAEVDNCESAGTGRPPGAAPVDVRQACAAHGESDALSRPSNP